MVKKRDQILDQCILEDYLSLIGISKKEFWKIADRWYNTELFEKNRFGVWNEKFELE